MTPEAAATVHPWDEGAIEPSAKQVAVAGLVSYFWLGLASFPLVPLGLIITMLRLGSMTGANTWGGRLKFGKKALLASLGGSALGFFVHAGLFLTKHGVSLRLL